MSFYMTFDNGKTNRNFHIEIAERPSIPIAEDNVEYIQIPGKDENLTRKDGFNNRQLQVQFSFSDKTNLIGYMRPFISQLRNSKSFYFSDDTSIEYRIKNVIISDIEREVRILGTFTVTFVIDPFCYYRNVATIDAKSVPSFTNIGDFYSKPYIKVTCNGTITDAQLVVNDLIMKFKTITDFIEIDSAIRKCYKGNPSNSLGSTVEASDYPILKTGINNINCSSNITHVYIEPRWRCF